MRALFLILILSNQIVSATEKKRKADSDNCHLAEKKPKRPSLILVEPKKFDLNADKIVYLGDYKERKVILVAVETVYEDIKFLPFYLSLEGTGEKIRGYWYPFSGIISNDSTEWFVKGTHLPCKSSYTFKSLQYKIPVNALRYSFYINEDLKSISDNSSVS
jgi:hypothetical protein